VKEVNMAEWKRRPISDDEMMTVIRKYGAPSTKEIKMELGTDGASIRKPLGSMYMMGKAFPMPYGKAIVWMEADGKKGYPNVKKRREAAGMPAVLGQWKEAKQVKPDLPEEDEEEEETYERWKARTDKWKAERSAKQGVKTYAEHVKSLKSRGIMPDADTLDALRHEWGAGKYDRDVGHEAASSHKPKDSSSDGRIVDWDE